MTTRLLKKNMFSPDIPAKLPSLVRRWKICIHEGSHQDGHEKSFNNCNFCYQWCCCCDVSFFALLSCHLLFKVSFVAPIFFALVSFFIFWFVLSLTEYMYYFLLRCHFFAHGCPVSLLVCHFCGPSCRAALSTSFIPCA